MIRYVFSPGASPSNHSQIYWQKQHHYVDFACVGAKHNSDFTRTCWEILPLFIQANLKININNTQFIVWSDGGLKGYDNLATFQRLSRFIGRTYAPSVFFAPHHGHSVCDGHFGSGKRALRNAIGSGVIIDPVLFSWSKRRRYVQHILLVLSHDRDSEILLDALLPNYVLDTSQTEAEQHQVEFIWREGRAAVPVKSAAPVTVLNLLRNE